MRNEVKYGHTNIIARNWKKLAQFYINVFECEPVFPERDLKGNWIDKMTNINNVRIKGIHLKLPGYENGPTLEIFEYDNSKSETEIPLVNNLGFCHIAFQVSDVEEIVEKIIANGGKKYGEIIENEVMGVGLLKAIYTRDPEGNIIEIQNWRK